MKDVENHYKLPRTSRQQNYSLPAGFHQFSIDLEILLQEVILGPTNSPTDDLLQKSPYESDASDTLPFVRNIGV